MPINTRNARPSWATTNIARAQTTTLLFIQGGVVEKEQGTLTCIPTASETYLAVNVLALQEQKLKKKKFIQMCFGAHGRQNT